MRAGLLLRQTGCHTYDPPLTDGKIPAGGKLFSRRKRGQTDYLLYHRFGRGTGSTKFYAFSLNGN